jgi:hypothetical protein
MPTPCRFCARIFDRPVKATEHELSSHKLDVEANNLPVAQSDTSIETCALCFLRFRSSSRSAHERSDCHKKAVLMARTYAHGSNLNSRHSSTQHEIDLPAALAASTADNSADVRGSVEDDTEAPLTQSLGARLAHSRALESSRGVYLWLFDAKSQI